MNAETLQITIQKVEKFISQKSLILPNEKVLIAISGGPDSVFLAYLLKELGYTIGLAHINYQLRGKTSEAEETLVKSLGKKWQIPVHSIRAHPKIDAAKTGVSMQVAARNIRYNFFAKIMKSHDYQKCATAHHRSDQTESILMSLTRGNNQAILTSIPSKRDRFIRPLLPINKNEILECLEIANLPWSHDISNDSSDYLRNKFRNQVIPSLKEINPSLESHLTDKNDWYQIQFEFIQKALNLQESQYLSSKGSIKRLSFSDFQQQFGEKFLPLLIMWALEKWGIHGKEAWETVKLLGSDSGKHIFTTEGKISRTRKGLVLETDILETKSIFIDEITHDQTIQFGHQTIHFSFLKNEKPTFGQPTTLFLDYEKIQFPIEIRRWKLGDKMKPLGMKSNKKLSDIFIDLKFDAAQKSNSLVFTAQNEIIAVIPFRISEQVKLTEHTKKTLKIVIES